MKPEHLCSLFFLLAISILMVGCSATSVKHYAAGEQPPLCRAENSTEKLVVYWGEAWRDDQKEVAKRSAVAEQVIEAFFVQSGALSSIFFGSEV